MKREQPAAFFDVDNTLVVGSTMERAFVRHLVRRGQLTWRDGLRCLVHFLVHPKHLRAHLIKSNKSYLKDKPMRTILAEARCCHPSIARRLSPEGRRRLLEHHQRGHRVVLVTGSLDFLLEAIKESLPVDDVIATHLSTRDGHFTGEVESVFPMGPGKRRLIEDFVREEGIDLAASYAYGDQYSDLPMLNLVGHPVAVNPKWRLRRLALKRGWPIVRF